MAGSGHVTTHPQPKRAIPSAAGAAGAAMHIMSGQDRSAAAAHETISLLRGVRTLAVQQTPVRDHRTPCMCYL